MTVIEAEKKQQPTNPKILDNTFLYEKPIEFNSELNAYMKNPMNIPGLYYFPNIITKEQEERALKIINSHEFRTTIHRRQQFYGEIYYHTSHDMKDLQPTGDQNAFPLQDLSWLIDDVILKIEHLNIVKIKPTQVLVNEYRNNMGIASHFEDENAFGDYILTVSLGDPIWMTLKKPKIRNNQNQDILAQTRVLLEPQSLLIMSGESRYKWRHGIPKSHDLPLPDGSIRKRDENYLRLSLTIRYLLDGRKRVNSNTDENREWVDHEKCQDLNE